MFKLRPSTHLHFKSNVFYDLSSPLSVTSLSETLPLSQPQFHHQQPLPQSHTQNPKSYISTLLNCRNLSHVRQVHAQIAINGLFGSLSVVNKLLYIYSVFRNMGDANALFSGMVEKDPYSWTVVVGGYYKVGDFVNCLRTFREIVRSGAELDNFTLPAVIRACRDMDDLKLGRLIHLVVCRIGLDCDRFVCAALVDMYAKCREIQDARQLFDKMPDKDLITWTVMIGAYAECGYPDESLLLFDRMREEGVVPDKIAMVNVVYSCAKLGAIGKARLVHDCIRRNKFTLDVVLGTGMIDMYAKCGRVDLAREIFDLMGDRNVITWSAMIAAYGYHGQGKKAVELFPLMLRNGIQPNRVSFVSLLYACSHAGLVEEGLRTFSIMQEYSVTPDVKHYTCMVDLLGRAGRLDDALNLIENITSEKNEGLWGALLGACRIHGKIEMAERAATSLLELQPQNPGHYVLLSNIYAKAGRWDDVSKIRNLMKQRNLKKVPGWTWIEVDRKIHQFSVGDKRHSRSMEIYHKLIFLLEKLTLAGYVPDINFVLHDVDEELKADILYTHSEKLAIAFGLIATPEQSAIQVTKNLRVCGDCHTFCKLVSAFTQRLITVRDSNRFHHFKEGICSCGEYW